MVSNSLTFGSHDLIIPKWWYSQETTFGLVDWAYQLAAHIAGESQSTEYQSKKWLKHKMEDRTETLFSARSSSAL